MRLDQTTATPFAPPRAGPSATGGMSPGVRRAVLGGAAALIVLVALIVFVLMRDNGGGSIGAPATTSPALTQPPLTVAPTTGAPATAAPVTPLPPTTAAPADDVDPVAVPGTVEWTDSGIDIAAGDLLHYRAEGTVAHNSPDPSSEVGPAGDARTELAVFNRQFGGETLSGQHGALIGRIADGEPFVMGEVGTVQAQTGGRVFLSVNDNGLDNNTGEFTVELAPQPAGG